MTTYCETNGITPHKYRKDPEAWAWDALQGEHYLCRDCGQSRLYIAHDKTQQKGKK